MEVFSVISIGSEGNILFYCVRDTHTNAHRAELYLTPALQLILHTGMSPLSDKCNLPAR